MKLLIKDCPEVVLELQHESLQCTLRFVSKPEYNSANENGVPPGLQHRIENCTSLKQLYRLLFATEDITPEVMNAFALRKLELEGVLVPPARRRA